MNQPNVVALALDHPDRALVLAVRNGDALAFDTFVRAHYADMVRFAESVVHAPDAAEDIVCTVFARLWMRREAWAPKSSAIAYVVMAVRNEALTLLRTEHRRGSLSERIALQSHEWLARTGDVETTIEQADILRRLHGMLHRLPETDRTAITLRWLHGMAFDDIAAVLGTTPAAVQTRLSRALKALRHLGEGEAGPPV